MGTTGQILYIKGDKNKEVTKSDVLWGISSLWNVLTRQSSTG